MEAAKAIIRSEGISSLFTGTFARNSRPNFSHLKGTAATLARNGTWNGGYFGSISFVRSALPPHQTKTEKMR